MGEDVETLEDLLRPGLRAVCVGINPAPRSVAAGHYYQGQSGQKFFRRLLDTGVVPAAPHGGEDDVAFAAGVGFTDIIKRPTASAKELRPEEYRHGKDRLLEKLEENRPGLVIFTFKKTAEALFGKFSGNGFVPRLKVASSEIFVMPGPYEDRSTAAATLRQLKLYVDGT